MIKDKNHRQIFLLTTAQALFQTGTIMLMTVGGLAGAAIAPQPYLATAPITAMLLGTAITTVPASMWMARAGRRVGFLTGALLGVLGGLTGAFGIFTESLVILCLGAMLVGGNQGFAQYYRFAAAEVADDAFKSRAISLVMAGGVVAALLGPLLVGLGGKLVSLEYAGPFLLLSALSLVAAGLLTRVRVPQPSKAEVAKGGSPLWTIIRRPTYFVALLGAVTGYGVMILAMTASPLAMVHHHHTLADAALGIQLHVLGMFLPSFFTGLLIARFGALRIMFAGVGLFAGHVLFALSGTGLESFLPALILLGVGWNFLYIGGTNLLTESYSFAERGRAQAANDMTVFVVGVSCSLGAGMLLEAYGWQRMNMLLLPWLAITASAILWLSLRKPVPEKAA